MPPSFASLIGSSILILVAGEHPTRYLRAKLLGVEAGGLWIESQTITNSLLRLIESAAAPKSPVVFLPYHQIFAVLISADEISLDEGAFGV